jgi:hypothetical protein
MGCMRPLHPWTHCANPENVPRFRPGQFFYAASRIKAGRRQNEAQTPCDRDEVGGIHGCKKVSQSGKPPEKFGLISEELAEIRNGASCSQRGKAGPGKTRDDSSPNRLLELAKRCFRPLSHLTKVVWAKLAAQRGGVKGDFARCQCQQIWTPVSPHAIRD